jgi:HAD superfamily hydrolase (TIGR01509 family)
VSRVFRIFRTCAMKLMMVSAAATSPIARIISEDSVQPPSQLSSIMTWRGVLLDVDGTLVDSNDAHAHAWVDVLSKHGHDVAFQRVRMLIGMGGDRLVEVLTGVAKDSDENEALGAERSQLFRDKWLASVRPLNGSRQLLLRLRADGLAYALATAAKSEDLQPLLEIADIADLVENQARTTSSEVEASKPAPDVIEAALAKLPTERSRVVMIGDTPYDVRAARDARVAIIGVTSGGWPADALAGAVFVASGPADLARRVPWANDARP